MKKKITLLLLALSLTTYSIDKPMPIDMLVVNDTILDTNTQMDMRSWVSSRYELREGDSRRTSILIRNKIFEEEKESYKWIKTKIFTKEEIKILRRVIQNNNPSYFGWAATKSFYEIELEEEQKYQELIKQAEREKLDKEFSDYFESFEKED